MIGADEVASHVNATTTQAFNVKMKKDSSDRESDGGDTDLDYGDDERVTVLSTMKKMKKTGKLQRVT